MKNFMVHRRSRDKHRGVLAFSFDGQYTEEGIRQKLIKLELLKEQQQSRNVCCCSSKLELGLLKEEEARRKHSSSSTVALKLPDELPSVEETLKTLAAALEALDVSGLDKSDVLRLRGIVFFLGLIGFVYAFAWIYFKKILNTVPLLL